MSRVAKPTRNPKTSNSKTRNPKRTTASSIRKSNPESQIRQKLLKWYDLHKRSLPWRKTRDPYRIWVSEIMLQQTRVQAVVPFYERFVRLFPDVQALAAADEQRLLACWSGLGYYSRARNLQKAAQMIVREYAGSFPSDLRAALRLPGVGEYTAAAVLSIAYGVPLPVLDGNVARVLARLYALPDDPKTARGKKILRQWANALLSRRRPGDCNQAFMELGATLCLPRQPRCRQCPLRSHCLALRRNQVERYPAVRKQSKPVTRRFTTALAFDAAGRVLLVRRARTAEWMGGFWESPLWEENSREGASRHQNLHRNEEPRNGIRLGSLLGHVQHTITSNRLHVAVYAARMDRRVVVPRERWVSLRQMNQLPVTTITRKALRLRH
ncbi:MAG: A/G-specific adenine glycosylase [Acidobacteria bacterium]|nr:A/G-specific adenine glycosylase [Acidobacteriota bacterium]